MELRACTSRYPPSRYSESCGWNVSRRGQLLDCPVRGSEDMIAVFAGVSSRNCNTKEPKSPRLEGGELVRANNCWSDL